MSDLNIDARALGAWSPAFDARKFKSPVIVNGQNFLDDVNGPRSYWASWFYADARMGNTTRVKLTELKVGDDIWLGTPTGIWRLNEKTGDYELLFEITTTQQYWPWSMALVGNVYYFAQYGIGIIKYDAATRSFTVLDNVPFGLDCKFICESYGRLIALTSTVVCWSALDDGTNFIPSLATGAGAQTLAILSFNAFRVDPTTAGPIVSTDKGLIIGRKVSTNYVFSWQNSILSRDVKIFTPNAGVIIPDVGYVCIDGAGFRVTDGDKPVLWETEMGEYLKKNYLNIVDRTKYGILDLYYSQTQRKLFVTFASNSLEGQAEITFVWNSINDRWCLLSHAHFGVFEQHSSAQAQDFLCYMSTNGYIRQFVETNFVENLPVSPYGMLDYFYSLYQDPPISHLIQASTGENIAIAVTEALSSDADPSYYTDTALISGVFYINNSIYADDPDEPAGDDPIIPDPLNPSVRIASTNCDFSEVGFVRPFAVGYTFPRGGLNSYVELGLFRFEEQRSANETSMVSSLVIGITPAENFIVFEDYNTEEADPENYNDDPDNETLEDWGAGFVDPDEFTATLVTTNDGNTPQLQGEETLNIEAGAGAGNLYQPYGWSGVYHKIKLYALNEGEAYYVRTIDLAGTMTGVTK